MEAAAELLRKTDRPVGEIALGVGYQNQSKFAHAFRPIYGMTPTEYKRERRMEPDLADWSLTRGRTPV